MSEKEKGPMPDTGFSRDDNGDGSAPEDLQRLWAVYREAGSGEGPPGDCPSTEVLAALARGDVVDGREQLLDHVLGCETCRLELRAAIESVGYVRGVSAESSEAESSEAESSGTSPDEKSKFAESSEASPVPFGRRQGTRRGARRWSRSSLLAAAVLLVIVGGGVWQLFDRPVDDDVVRSGAALQVEPGVDAVLERFPEQFSWPAQAGASGYALRLYSRGSELLWQGPVVTENELRVPAQPLQEVSADAPGMSFYWEVEVSGPVAEPVLGPFRFEVAAVD